MIHLLRLNIVTIYCRQFPVFNTEMHNRFKSHFSCLLGPIHESEGDIEVREMGIHEKKQPQYATDLAFGDAPCHTFLESSF